MIDKFLLFMIEGKRLNISILIYCLLLPLAFHILPSLVIVLGVPVITGILLGLFIGKMI